MLFKVGSNTVWYLIVYHDQGIFYIEGKGYLGLLVSEESLPLPKAEKFGSSQRAEGLHLELQTEHREWIEDNQRLRFFKSQRWQLVTHFLSLSRPPIIGIKHLNAWDVGQTSHSDYFRVHMYFCKLCFRGCVILLLDMGWGAFETILPPLAGLIHDVSIPLSNCRNRFLVLLLSR